MVNLTAHNDYKKPYILIHYDASWQIRVLSIPYKCKSSVVEVVECPY